MLKPTFWYLALIALAGCTGSDSTAPPPAASVTVVPNAHTMDIGSTMQLSATALDSNGDVIVNARFSWSSSNQSVATVSSAGAVMAVAQGEVSITATSGGQAGAATITVADRSSAPWRVRFSTGLGGNLLDQVRDVAIDPAGNVYVVGGTEGGGFSTTAGVLQPSHNNGVAETSAVVKMDVFVTKFDADGRRVWSTYLGGPNYDRAYAVEVDAQGFVYVAGRAGAGFPVTTGAFQTTFSGGSEADFYGNQDGFICKLKPDASAVVFCSYFGTADAAIVRDIAVNQSGEIYLASGRKSGSYPSAVASRFTNSPPGGDDAVIAKVRSDGTALLWATYLGGSDRESNQNSVRVDGAGNPYILFTTHSLGIATAGAYDRSFGGDGDVFVNRLNPSTGAVVWGSYVGGSGNESTETHELAVDAAGNVYIAAPTLSGDFPTTAGVFRRTKIGTGNEIFVSKLSPDGSQLIASTLLGGSANDRPEGVAVDAAGNVYITGITSSADFPLTSDAHQRALQDADAFAVILSSDFSTLLYSTFLGGGNIDLGRSAAVSGTNEFVIGAETHGGWPMVNAQQSGYSGGTSDGAVVKIRR